MPPFPVVREESGLLCLRSGLLHAASVGEKKAAIELLGILVMILRISPSIWGHKDY